MAVKLREKAARWLLLGAWAATVLVAGCSSDCLKIQQCHQGWFGRSCSMVCPAK